MNFEKPYNKDPNEFPLGEKVSKRQFLKTALGAAVSVGITKAVVDVLPKFENQKKENKSVLIKVREPILKEDEFLETEDIESETIFEEEMEKRKADQENRESISWKEFKKLKPSISYKEVVPPLHVENLRMPHDVSRYGATTHEGKLLRTLRYKNITDEVEYRYNLPPGILLAMIMEESTGVDLLPNARGDGGFGLCHMQGSTAAEFGLKTFHDCNVLVCNGKDKRSCKDSTNNLKDHAGELVLFMKKNAGDRKKLVEVDERLNILLNIDAAGRILATGISGPKLSGRLSELGPFRRSIARYSGAYNYENYWKDICRNMKDLTDPDVLKKIEEEFNKKNPNLKINGIKSDFKEYLKKFQEQHANYGLEEYKSLPKYLPKNSVAVIKTYRDYI